MAFVAELDASELDLIESVAKELDPVSWLEGFFRGEAELAMQKRNQQLARDKAITIIAIVRRARASSHKGE